MALTTFKAVLLGILLVLGGVGFLAGDVSIPGFLYGASLGGVWSLLAPFLLIIVGSILILASLANMQQEKKGPALRTQPVQ